MTGKTESHFLFQVELDWKKETRTRVMAKGKTKSLEIDSPSEFGGDDKLWSPEHLLLASLSSCFISTCLAFARKIRLTAVRMDCDTIGQIDKTEGMLKFTYINLYPRLIIEDESEREKANTVLDKARKYCIISNSLAAEILYHSEVLVERGREVKLKEAPEKKVLVF